MERLTLQIMFDTEDFLMEELFWIFLVGEDIKLVLAFFLYLKWFSLPLAILEGKEKDSIQKTDFNFTIFWAFKNAKLSQVCANKLSVLPCW